jgi:hypothetical protein
MMSDLRPTIKGFQKTDLRYPIEQDGTLTYCVKDHSGGRLEWGVAKKGPSLNL